MTDNMKETLQTLPVDTGTHPIVADDEAAEAVGAPTKAATAFASPPASQTTLALFDLIEGVRVPHLWGLLGWQDIRGRYRRSKLGPFWITISMGVLVAVLGTLYGGILKVEITAYLPHLTLGFIVWGLISGLITESCSAFTSAGSIITQVNLPLSVHVYRVIWRNLIIFFHNAVIFVVVAVTFSIWPGWAGLLALPGLALICLNGVWAGMLLGAVSARFRDVPPIVSSIVRIVFFVTPIIWMPELLPNRAVFLDLNPFFHILELVRAPLLGQVPGLTSWLAVFGMTLVGWLLMFVLFRLYRWRIAYWV